MLQKILELLLENSRELLLAFIGAILAALFVTARNFVQNLADAADELAAKAKETPEWHDDVVAKALQVVAGVLGTVLRQKRSLLTGKRK